MDCLCLCDSPGKNRASFIWIKEQFSLPWLHWEQTLRNETVFPRGPTERQSAGLWRKEEVYISGKSFLWTKTEQDKQTVHVSGAWLWIQLGKSCPSGVKLGLKVIGSLQSKRGPRSWKQKGEWRLGVCDSCVVTVSKLICSNSQWLLHFTQSTWLSHLHTLPPYGQ